MSKEQLKHIFEESACLTPRQMKGYVTGKMVHEEAHAVEVHLLSCPFCKEAVEGLMEQKDKGALQAMEKLDASFIASHFGVSKKELNLGNTPAPPGKSSAFKTFTTDREAKGKTAVRKLWKPMSAAAAVIAVGCIMWFMRDTIFPKDDHKQLAQQAELPPPPQEQEIVYRPVADSAATDTTATEMLAMEETPTGEAVPAEVDIQPVPADTPKKTLDALAIAKEKEQEKAKKAELLKKEAEQKAADINAVVAMEAAKKPPVPKDALAGVAEKPAALPAQRPTAEERGRMGNSYEPASVNDYVNKPATTAAKTPEKTVVAEPEPPAKKLIELGTARSGILKGDEAFNDGKYKKALKLYQKVMYDPESNQKDAATLMAAKCHIAMDQMMQARTLLNSLVRDNSIKKDEAATLLKQVPKE